MTGEERRADILSRIRQSSRPVAARALAEIYGVSRQVIVQDMALIRASGHEILSTNRGYLLQERRKISRIFKVRHSDEQLEEELCAIVDLGGCVENVIVHHKVYGRLEAHLGVDSRRKVRDFLEDLRSGKSSPLKNYHLRLSLSRDQCGFCGNAGADRRPASGKGVSGENGIGIS